MERLIREGIERRRADKEASEQRIADAIVRERNKPKEKFRWR